MTTQQIDNIRKFNRFYTQKLGLLNSSLLKSGHSLIEARILFELEEMPGTTATDLIEKLKIDPAYLSRILHGLKSRGLIYKTRSKKDSRKRLLALSPKGQKAFSGLKKLSNEQVTDMISSLTEEEQHKLVHAMTTIETLMDQKQKQTSFYSFRRHRPGDIGYIAHRHGVFYSQEYGFDSTFDAYVAEGTAKFVLNFDPDKERLWIAEEGSDIVGSIAIVKVDHKIAQLRWLLVEPLVKGKGLGKKLVEEAVDFCRRKGYHKIILWTLTNLIPARNLYEKTGFQIKDKKSHRVWGKDLTEELWELDLRPFMG